MKNAFPPAPNDKKLYIQDIGKILVSKLGKQKYYIPDDVKRAHDSSTWSSGEDYSSWAMCTFCTHEDFDLYHQEEEDQEHWVYQEMKAEILGEMFVASIENPDVLSMPDIDSSWLDFDDVFEGLFEGIGEFVSGIFDSI